MLLPKEKEAQSMEITATAANRKDIAKAIAEFIGEQPVYLGPPTFAYRAGDFTVDRDGVITTEDEAAGEEVRQMLTEQGFIGAGEAQEEAESSTAIKVPLTGMTGQGITNLANLIHSKQYLLNRAVGKEGFSVNGALIVALGDTQFITAEDAVSFIKGFEGYGTGFSFEDGCIVFDGFPYSGDDATVKAYSELSAAMVKAAREQKRIRPDETIEKNEKYYMRTWLVRLGFDGREAKETRRILLDNLKGHTAFRTEADKVKWNERQKAKKAASVTESGVE